MWIIVLILIAVIALRIWAKYTWEAKKLEWKYKHRSGKKQTYNRPTGVRNYGNSYKQKYLLTRNEYYHYKTLRVILDKYGLVVCPKVRLLDIIEPINGSKDKGALAKIQSKHVDFVICDKDLYVRGIIELDDSSHDRPDRIERDQFVDEIMKNVGYKIIHVREITEESIKEILPIQWNSKTESTYTGYGYK